MPGVFVSPRSNRSEQRPQTVCVECGHVFQPHAHDVVADELCDRCYEGQTQPVRLHLWQRTRNVREHQTR